MITFWAAMPDLAGGVQSAAIIPVWGVDAQAANARADNRESARYRVMKTNSLMGHDA
jgi:hypothetical protein